MESSVQGISKEGLPAMVEEHIVSYFDKMDGKSEAKIKMLTVRTDSPRTHAESDPVSSAASPLSMIPKSQLLLMGEDSPGSASMAGSTLNRDLVLAKLNKEKVLSLIKAWEENMKRKSLNCYNKKISKVNAWEGAKKARAEASFKTSEERLENKRAACIEKAKNKIAMVNRMAEEQRALAEARHGQEVLKAEEVATKCRASGSRPRKFMRCF